MVSMLESEVLQLAMFARRIAEGLSGNLPICGDCPILEVEKLATMEVIGIGIKLGMSRTIEENDSKMTNNSALGRYQAQEQVQKISYILYDFR